MSFASNHPANQPTKSADYLGALLPLMNANVPRVWAHVPGTELCEPVRPDISHGHPRCGGAGGLRHLLLGGATLVVHQPQ